MRKNGMIFLLIVMILLLVACGGNQSQANTPTDETTTNNSSQPIADTGSEPATCTAQSEQSELLHEGDFVKGAVDDYAVTIIVYSDFSCEGCAAMASTLETAVQLYPDDVRLVYRYFPVLGGENDNGVVAAKAAEAAGLQGMFWEMHDILFSTQETWVNMDEETFTEYIWSYVVALGLDLDQFNEDVNSEAINEKIATDYNEAINFGSDPPVVFVNGSTTPVYLSTVGDFYQWLETLMIPYGRHLQDMQFSDCPPMTVDPEKDYIATLHTEKGDIVLALYPEAAPMAVNSFVFLAENDYYDNTPFYAVIEGFVVQAGDPSGTGWGTPGYLFGLETSPDLTFERPYMLAMANGGLDANNSQFFITYSPLNYLNGKYTIFGEVLDGVDVLKSLAPRDPEANPLAPFTDYLLDVTVDEK